MSNLYDDFEKRFSNAFFSIGWSDVETKPQKVHSSRKDLETLQTELEQIQEHIETVAQKQLRLSNLAKLYE